ncbi:MAG: polysaccharide biosynthesis/export family protein, partial [Desulfobacterales bacterium]|nr:polysaccharide biosynthesis/export family protein [Desulfobacterales bacterium]
MMISTRLRLIMAMATALFICACGAGGQVVKVTTPREGSYAGLKEEDRARLHEFKNPRVDKGIDGGLKAVIDATRHFTVSEYLMQHPEARDRAGSDYGVGGYDVLSITVYEEKDLSKEAVRVSADGYISFPLIGRIKVNGLTTSEIEKLISFRLANEQYVLDAHVSIMVTGYNSKRFLVLGAARNPGSYCLQARERVLDVISRAGGIDFKEAGKNGMIIRTENPNTEQERRIVINLDLYGLLKGRDQISNIFLADKDVLFIPAAENFYIIGQVKEPGSYSLTEREITLVEAISMA